MNDDLARTAKMTAFWIFIIVIGSLIIMGAAQAGMSGPLK